MAETALEKAQRKFEQAKAALDAIKARESAEERKKDTRRKIVLGGALLDLSKSDKEASALVSRLIAGLTRDHDKKLFEKPAKGNGAAEPAKVEAQAPALAPAPVATKREVPPMPSPFGTKSDATPAEPAKTREPQTEPKKDFMSPKSSGYGSFTVRPDSAEI